MSEPKKVLVVDDNEDILSMTAIFLTRAGFVVTSLSDSSRALNSLAGGCVPDIILSDVRMPGISGLELATRLRELAPSLPVVLMSAHLEIREAHLASVNAKAFLRKPFTKDELVGMIESVLHPPINARQA